MRRFLPAILLSALASCCNTEVDRPRPADVERGVSEAIIGMYSAFQQRDLAKVGQFMTPESTCYDAIRSEMLNGRQAVLDHFGAILAEHKAGEAWESSIEGMKVTSNGDMACATYRVRTSAGGRHAVAAVTHIFARIEGRWLAVHLHRSWNAAPK